MAKQLEKKSATAIDLSSVAVVVLNYNGHKHLGTFLPSVVEHSGNARIIVADNGSTDASKELLAENPLFRKVELIAMPHNKGFCGGYNEALAQVQATYYVLLNSDVEVCPNWLQPMFALLETQPEIAACQPKILSYTSKDYFEHAGAGGGYIDYYGYPFCRGRMFSEVEMDQGQYDDTRAVFWASGACMMVRANLYHEAGGLDEDFFAHMEEIDLCWRLHNMGYQVAYCGNACVYHLGGGTLNYQSPKKLYLNYRNNLFMLYKNLPGRYLFKVLIIRLCLDGVSAMPYFFKLKWAYVWKIFLSHIHFYQKMGKMRKKRGIVKANREAVHPLPSIYHKSLVVDFFAKKKKKFPDLKWRSKAK